MSGLLESWVESANSPDTPFPLNNLPACVFSLDGDVERCGIGIGDMILDVAAAEVVGLIRLGGDLFKAPSWNRVMSEGPMLWSALRARLTELLDVDGPDKDRARALLVPRARATLHMPFTVSEYTDFYCSADHARNVGTILRGTDSALTENWLSVPIGYNGRASSVVLSGTEIRRPWGQVRRRGEDLPQFMPTRRFDIELELGAVVGLPSDGPVSLVEADRMIFGYVLLNDWSARDVQAWESQPLGPFQSKATATSVSPWIVMKDALDPFRVAAPERQRPLLPHLADKGDMHYDIDLSISLMPDGGEAHRIATTNARQLYYSPAQQLCHHTTSGCPMRTGDLLGSGTISGPERDERGSLLELSWGGREPIELPDGTERTFIADGDTLILEGAAVAEDYLIGFGECSGKVLPALADPFSKTMI